MNPLKKLFRMRDYDSLLRRLHFVETSNKVEREACVSLQAQNEQLRERLRRCDAQHRFNQDLAEDPPSPDRVKAAFALVDDATPWWRALHWLLRLQKDEETAALCLPNCDSDVRHYRSGRLAQIQDLTAALHQKRAEAQKENA